MHRSLEAFKSILSYRQSNDENGKLKQIVTDQRNSLSLCHQETSRQFQELKLKFEARNRDLRLSDNVDYAEKCKDFCDTKNVSLDSMISEPRISSNKSIRLTQEKCKCDQSGCYAFVSLHEC